MITEALLCLALNIYHEARGQSVRGQEAVAVVTMFRAEFQPNQVCTEVFRPKQFSWTKGLSSYRNDPSVEQLQKLTPKTNAVAWKKAKHIARLALEDKITSPAKSARFFYNPKKANPIWKGSFIVVARIDDHIFLK